MTDAYTLSWIVLVPNRVYLSIGTGDVTAEQLRIFDREFITLIDASDAPLVHLISDSRQVLSLPPLSEMRKNRYPYHARMGYSLTIGAFKNPVMRFVLSISSAISNIRYKDVDTMDEACLYLAHRDPALPPVETWSIPPLDGSIVS